MTWPPLLTLAGAAVLAPLIGLGIVWAPTLLGGLPLPRLAQVGPLALPYALLGGIATLAGLGWTVQGILGRTGFVSLFFLSLLAASQMNGIGFGPFDLFDLVLFGFAAGWAIRVARAPGASIRLSPLLVLASALVVLAIAHMPLMSPVPWFIGVFGVVRVALLTLLVVDMCRDVRMLDFVARTFVAVAAASAAIGIAQFALAYLDLFFFTLIAPPLSAFKPSPVGFVMRASGLAITAQHFSSFMVYALPFALWRFTETWRVLDAVAVALLGAGLLVSLNFGGIFAGMLVVAIFPFLRWPDLAIHLLLGGLAVLALSYFAGGIDLIHDLTFGDAGVAKGVDQRKTLFSLGLARVDASPWIGTGLRGFAETDGNFWGRPVHNLFLQAATELGLTGCLVFVAIFFMLTLGLARAIPGGGPGAKYPRILLTALASTLLLAQNEPNLEQSNLWLVLALAQAVIMIRGAPIRLR